jgi:hypothetical protein
MCGGRGLWCCKVQKGRIHRCIKNVEEHCRNHQHHYHQLQCVGLLTATRHGGAWGERRYSSYSFTTSALDGGEWSASRPGRAFTLGERTPGTHCTGGWVGPRADLDTEDRGKILCPCRGSNPDRPVVQPVVRLSTAWANPSPYIWFLSNIYHFTYFPITWHWSQESHFRGFYLFILFI